MDANEIAFFVAVMDAGSFANASRKLGIDRSNISRRIHNIEKEIGAVLLARTTRSMRPTEAGEILYERGVAINAQVTEANRAVLSLRSEVRGPLHISCAPLLWRLHMQKIFWAFCAEHPEVQLSITLRNEVNFTRESVDVALRVIDDLVDTVVARQLGHVSWNLCASPAYLRRNGTPKTPQELAEHAWLSIRTRPMLEFTRGIESWRVKPFSRVECGSHSVLHEAALAGLGLGFVPSYATHEDFARRRLVPLLTGYDVLPTPGTRLYAVTPKSRYVASQVRCLLDFLCEKTSGEPVWQKKG
ncbi:LysR family transcriptional regulator [Ottowia thiooxydans]|uniref:LysR family transcriptional regulator n=1 Tax=Ottowia thiooxydans TaxID=219182 RepID=UPI0006882EEC|nr:LysR family transcriptional regulator [Ottowia thiooxydans]